MIKAFYFFKTIQKKRVEEVYVCACISSACRDIK